MLKLSDPPTQASPYTPAGGGNSPPMIGRPPVLGAILPGSTGALPPKPGLSATQNPLAASLQGGVGNDMGSATLSNPNSTPTANPASATPSLTATPASPTPPAAPQAQAVQSMGRGNDSVLIHMTPEEVNSLRGLAQRFGGDLTTNPHTGLPEAGWLGDLLPTLLGGLLSFVPGVGPLMAAGIIGAGETAITGDIGKGLTAGLQAFGGASLGGALGAGSVFGSNAASGAAQGIAQNVAGQAASAGQQLGAQALGAGSVFGSNAATGAAQGIAQNVAGQAANAGNALAGQSLAGAGANFAGAQGLASLPAAASAPAATPGFLDKFSAAAQQGVPKGVLAKSAPWLAGTGLMSAVSEATQPRPMEIDPEKSNYAGPYKYAERKAQFYPTSEILNSSKEKVYFNTSQPALLDKDGKVVYPGSGETPLNAPVAPPPSMGGVPAGPLPPPWTMPEQAAPGRGGVGNFHEIKDGRYRDQWFAGGGEVHLKDGSFIVDARTVSELGNGSSNAGIEMLSKLGGKPLHGPGDGVSDSIPATIAGKQEARVARDEVYMPPEAVRRVGGAKKLYALMDKAHKARKSAKRGQDTGLAKGLGAL